VASIYDKVLFRSPPPHHLHNYSQPKRYVFKKERRMSNVSPAVNHLVQFSFVDRDQSIVYQIDEDTAQAMKDYLNEFEKKSWPFHWFQTVHGLDIAVSQDGIEMVNLLYELGEGNFKEWDTDNDFDLVIHFRGRGTVPQECDVADPKELTRLFLALNKGYDEDGPFLSFVDQDDQPVLLDARKILYIEAPAEVIEEGWKEVIREDLEGVQTALRTDQPDLVPPRGKKTTRPSRTRKSAKP
jgi:hypothetical protein